MTNEEFKPFLICDRSSAILHMMDAIQLTDLELTDVCNGICERLGVPSFRNPEIAFEVHEEGSIVPPPDEESVKESLQGILKECNSNELLTFQVTPHEALSILGMVQASIMSSITTENLEIFGRQFIGQFCDCHRSDLPSICEALETGRHEAYQMTRDEFDELADEHDHAINEPFNGDGYDRFVENLIDDLQGEKDDYVDDFE